MGRSSVFRVAVLLAWALAGGASAAPPSVPAAVRDPMQPPAPTPRAAGAGTVAAGTTTAAPSAWRALQVIIGEGGCAYVVERGRRYGVGDAIGAVRIEAIDERGVLVREAGSLHRVPLFGAVVKRPSERQDAEAADAARAAASPASNPTAAAGVARPGVVARAPRCNPPFPG